MKVFGAIIGLLFFCFLCSCDNTPTEQVEDWKGVTGKTKWIQCEEFMTFGGFYVSDDYRYALYSPVDKEHVDDWYWRAVDVPIVKYQFRDVDGDKICWELVEPIITDAIIDGNGGIIWTAHSDGYLYKRNLETGQVLGSIKILPDDARDEMFLKLGWYVKGESLFVQSKNERDWHNPDDLTVSFHTRIAIIQVSDLNILHDYKSLSDYYRFINRKDSFFEWNMNGEAQDKIKLCKVETGEAIKSFTPINDWSVTNVVISKDGMKVVASVGGVVHVWDMVSTDLLYTIKGHLLGILEESGKALLTVNDFNKKAVSNYNLSTGDFLYQLDLGHNEDVVAMYVSYDSAGKFMAVCDSLNRMTLFDIDIKKKVYSYDVGDSFELSGAQISDKKPAILLSENEPIRDAVPIVRYKILKPFK